MENDKQYNLWELRKQLIKFFNESELRDICFDLNLDYESLAGSGKQDKGRELIAQIKREHRISDLVLICKRQRPDVKWGKIDFAGKYYVNDVTNNTIVIKELSENEFHIESPKVWHGMGIFDGQNYLGVFRYYDNVGRLSGVIGTHHAELRSDGSFAVHGTNIINATGEFDNVWNKLQ